MDTVARALKAANGPDQFSVDVLGAATEFLRMLVAAELFATAHGNGLYGGAWAELAAWREQQTAASDCGGLAAAPAPPQQPYWPPQPPYTSQPQTTQPTPDPSGHGFSPSLYQSIAKPAESAGARPPGPGPDPCRTQDPPAGTRGGEPELAAWEVEMQSRLLASLPRAAWLLRRLTQAGFGGSRAELEAAVERYCRFLLLAQRYQYESLLFPPDVQLVWWAHKAHNSAYLADMDLLMGCPFDMAMPDPADDPEAARRTADLYEEEYGLPYDMSYCTAAPGSGAASSSLASPEGSCSGASAASPTVSTAAATTAAAAAAQDAIARCLAPLLTMLGAGGAGPGAGESGRASSAATCAPAMPATPPPSAPVWQRPSDEPPPVRSGLDQTGPDSDRTGPDSGRVSSASPLLRNLSAPLTRVASFLVHKVARRNASWAHAAAGALPPALLLHQPSTDRLPSPHLHLPFQLPPQIPAALHAQQKAVDATGLGSLGATAAAAAVTPAATSRRRRGGGAAERRRGSNDSSSISGFRFRWLGPGATAGTAGTAGSSSAYASPGPAAPPAAGPPAHGCAAAAVNKLRPSPFANAVAVTPAAVAAAAAAGGPGGGVSRDSNGDSSGSCGFSTGSSSLPSMPSSSTTPSVSTEPILMPLSTEALALFNQAQTGPAHHPTASWACHGARHPPSCSARPVAVGSTLGPALGPAGPSALGPGLAGEPDLSRLPSHPGAPPLASGPAGPGLIAPIPKILLSYLVWIADRELPAALAATAAADAAARASKGRRALQRLLLGSARAADAASAERSRHTAKALARSLVAAAAGFSSLRNLPMSSDHPFWADACPGAVALAGLCELEGGAGAAGGPGGGAPGLQVRPSPQLQAVLRGEAWAQALAKAVAQASAAQAKRA
ncbi:hypothetical protein HYH03_013846 [Edaphochlamys debaryana]|uniref:Uncharacterized protein n=1 Tax=Edaphochlamys debaryana TaxID=47281 RepID=A0A835XQ86_9CHLO|nr:hypothetical protein HYH03_013846 [Edaphochlamys debaryana]|eukprot:KAG2487567.1 hypothetical protein HYH03_013846 [Edaphochlamys debaryana]